MERILIAPSMRAQLRWTQKHNHKVLQAIRKEENLRKRLIKERERQAHLEAVLDQLQTESRADYREMVEYNEPTTAG